MQVANVSAPLACVPVAIDVQILVQKRTNFIVSISSGDKFGLAGMLIASVNKAPHVFSAGTRLLCSRAYIVLAY